MWWMIMNQKIETNSMGLSKPFWVVWGVELWERFGYYGVQAIIALYFVQQLGFSEKESMYIFGAFSAFVFGFVWIGGFIGDNVLGAKRTVILGTVVLLLSYIALALADHKTVYFALGGIIVGNALFKANPSSLISKMFKKGDPRLDGAMTMYYMAINVGSFVSMSITPAVSEVYGWHAAFWICAAGLFLGLLNFTIFYRLLDGLSTNAGRKVLNWSKLFVVICLSAIAVVAFGILLQYPMLCFVLVYIVVAIGFTYFLFLAFRQKPGTRARMLIAFILMIEAVIFYVLYNQMPTSLTFFAQNNINNNILGFQLSPAQYQVLNPFFIVLFSPLLAIFYKSIKSTHATKFCIGMTFCGLAFLSLFFARWTSSIVLAQPWWTATMASPVGMSAWSFDVGLSSPWWLVLSYALQAIGELLVSGLGLAMVAELCPAAFSGFVMGVWFLTSMLAGPIGAKVGGLTSVPTDVYMTTAMSLERYTQVFGWIGLVVLGVALLMWIIRPLLNKFINVPEHGPENHEALDTIEPHS